jgi:hypothetical protein
MESLRRLLSENMRRVREEVAKIEAPNQYLLKAGWTRTNYAEFGESWRSPRSNVGLPLQNALEDEFRHQEDEKRKEEIRAGTAEVLCNKCGGDMRTKRIADDGVEFFTGYYGMIDASVSGGFLSEHLDDVTTYRFSLCEKCLAELFGSFAHPPRVDKYW